MFDEYYDDEDEDDIGEFIIPGRERDRSKLPYVNPDDEDKIRCSTIWFKYLIQIFHNSISSLRYGFFKRGKRFLGGGGGYQVGCLKGYRFVNLHWIKKMS